jgi:hypothetical protein
VSDPGIWGWTSDVGRLGFTVTFSLGRSADEVLRLYGADSSQAEHLTRDGAWIMFPPNNGGAQLRAGTLGRWGFCYEEAGFEGFKARTLSALSADTETISFFHSAGKSSFIYLKDSEGIEAFEPGLPETLRGDQPCRFYNDVHRIMEREHQAGPILPAHAVLQAITKHIREPLDRATLEGPLLTAFLPDADRAPMGVEFDETAAPAPAAPSQPGPSAQSSGTSSFPRDWDTGPQPIVVVPTATSTPAQPAQPPRTTPTQPPTDGSSYDPVYSRFSRSAQAS